MKLSPAETAKASEKSYIDPHGILRSKVDGSVVVWHYNKCTVTGLVPADIVYADDGAPWCPQCWQKKRLKEFFGKA